MLSAAIALLLTSPYLMLRLSDGSGSFPKPLTAEEERKYVDLHMQGDTKARDILIERNLRLVAHIIKKYYTQNCDQDDLIQIGSVGLIKGISTYKPEKKVRLATYASRCIENAKFFCVTRITPFRRCRKIYEDFAPFKEYVGGVTLYNYTFENSAQEL